MFLNAQNGTVPFDNTEMEYISFGKGNQTLVILPGLGESLTTVKGKALPFAIAYKIFAEKYKVYVFSRKNSLKKGYSTRDMAKDQADAMKILGIRDADVIGVSQGGMISQYLAIDYPDLVNKLVLAVTLSKQNQLIQNVVTDWIDMANRNDFKGIVIDTAEKSYSESYLKRYRPLYPILGRIGKPKNFNRFLIQANSCIQHNAYPELDKIKCATFIIGGDKDKIVGVSASAEMSDRIKDSRLFIYKGLGHAAYEEAKDFNARVIDFLNPPS